jgi:hypothetical protein
VCWPVRQDDSTGPGDSDIVTGSAPFREAVFEPGRVLSVGDALQDLVLGEVIEPIGQDVPGDRQPGLKEVDLGHAQEDVTHE